MNLSEQIAKHFRDVHFGGNWTTVNLKDQLASVTWQQATTQVATFHTIATLAYHSHYFVAALLNVLRGNALDANDKFSFDCPPIRSAEDWQGLQNKYWRDAEEVAVLLEKFPEDQLFEVFAEAKYGSYYRNIHGIIEHAHYHLGQIVMIKKLIACG